MPKIEMNKQYENSRGPVRILCTDRPHHAENVVALTKTGFLFTTNSQGESSFGINYDLIEVKPRIKRTIWVNLYPEEKMNDIAHNREDFAKNSAGLSIIARVKVEIDCEEGEGLN